ncbi:hypothetical protein BKA70DRAFT_1241739 [Coprinopsis sp. MPI-PUGE-AT-0042]|nr:hypothetical protein BKA70DRAFT_1241739 [Coprinopsis sp. MPI-PUGE-AT-0042]
MSVPNESQNSHCSGPVLPNSVTMTPNEYASQLSWAVDQLRSDGKRRDAELGRAMVSILGFWDGPLLLPRILQDALFQLVDHRTPLPHLVLQWTRDDSQITQRSGSPRGAGASRGGGRRARLVEEDSQGHRPTYGATGHHHSDPHIQPTPLRTPHRLPLAAKTVVCCVPSRLFLPLNETLSRFNGSEMEVELDDVRDHNQPDEQAALQTAASVDGSRPLRASPVEEEGPGQYTQSPRHPPLTPATLATNVLQHHVDRDHPIYANSRLLDLVKVEHPSTNKSSSYTIFDALLPKLHETGKTLEPELSCATPKGSKGGLWDVVAFTVGRCPGLPSVHPPYSPVLPIRLSTCPPPILNTHPCNAVDQLGAYLIEPRLSRRWSLAGGIRVTACFCLVFAVVTSPWAIRSSTSGISLHATARHVVRLESGHLRSLPLRREEAHVALYLLCLECGMIAPILGGILLSPNLPVYTSVVFLFATAYVVMLKEEPRGTSKPGSGKKGGSRLCSDAQRF